MTEPRRHELGFFIYDEPITVELGSWYSKHPGTDVIHRDIDESRSIISVLAYAAQGEDSLKMKKWFIENCDRTIWEIMIGLPEDAERIMSSW